MVNRPKPPNAGKGRKKRCSACKGMKTLREFHRNNTKPGGYQSQCRVCVNAKQKAWYERSGKTHMRTQQLRKDFGLSADEYAALVSVQGGRCAICGDAPGGARPHLSVDHDHTTGVIRALLCLRCNVGLGQFKEDPLRLASAIAYLRNHEQSARVKSCGISAA